MTDDWPIGLSTGCFYQTPIHDTLLPIRDAGFARLEICSFPDHLDYHDLPAVARVAAHIRHLGLEAYSFHAPFADRIDISSLDPVRRTASIDEIRRAADAAAELGAIHFVIHPGPESDRGHEDDRLARMGHAAESLDTLASHCRRLGVSLLLENMLPHLFSGHSQDLLWLFGAMQSTDVGFCLDTGHAFLAGDLMAAPRKFTGFLRMIHASDNRGRGDDHLPPGDGMIPWDPLLSEWRDVEFGGAIILEIAGTGDPKAVLESAQRGRSFLRDLCHLGAPRLP